MIIDLPLPSRYRLVSVQQVRRKSAKGWLQVEWAVALCVDRPNEECGVHYGFGQAPTWAAATDRALAQSQWREEQDKRHGVQVSLLDLSDLVI